MTNRERALAILNYQEYDRLPIVHFGFLAATLEKWRAEGHLTEEEIRDANYGDSENGERIGKKLGFDFNWGYMYCDKSGFGSLFPPFERIVVARLPEGFDKIRTPEGVLVMEKAGTHSIPQEVDHLLKDRKSWEKHYLPRLQFTPDRLDFAQLEKLRDVPHREKPAGLYCNSLYGQIRNWLGIVGISYLAVDDEALFIEIIDTVGDLCYRVVEATLATGVPFDFAHFWEDICFKNGPLVHPAFFERRIGPHYKKIADLLHRHGVNILSVDCDGLIDSLIPTWIENGVNTMFPIEVGTWGASIAPWRKKYGKALRGVGGMDKRVLAYDYGAIDAEIERLKPLVELGGYIPCPDHRLPHDVKWENVQYYCDRMRHAFGS